MLNAKQRVEGMKDEGWNEIFNFRRIETRNRCRRHFYYVRGRACRQSRIWLSKKRQETMAARRGCIIKDELVTISNRQTNWTTLGPTPWCTRRDVQNKNHHRSYQLRYQDNDDPARGACLPREEFDYTIFSRIRPAPRSILPYKNSFRFFHSVLSHEPVFKPRKTVVKI